MLLAIDTATRTISLALHDGQRVVAETSWLTANHHTVELTPGIERMFNQAGIGPTDLQAIAVAIGPGSYTGLRIGLGVAKGLALSVGAELIGLPTPDILAAAQGSPLEEERLCVLLQAGRDRVLGALYDWRDGRWCPSEQAFIATWPELVTRLDATPTRIVGELDKVGRAALVAGSKQLSVLDGAISLRRAGYLAELGWQRLRQGQTDESASLAPLYLFNPDGSKRDE